MRVLRRVFSRLVQGLLPMLLLLPCAQAMTLEVVGNQVFATGPVGDDLPRFEAALAQPGIDTVVFVNSPGGDLWTGLRVGHLIAGKGLNTVIAGTCVSACSIMFMGGKERRFADTFRPNLTYIGIHGAHNLLTKRVDPALQPQIYAFYKTHMGDKFNSDVINRALYEMDDAGALLRVFDPVRSAATRSYHCRSFQTIRDQCTRLDGVTAETLGVVTHAALAKVAVPPAMLATHRVWGQELAKELPDLVAYLNDLAARQCATEPCRKAALEWADKPENRAVAVPTQGLGRSLPFNADTPAQATTRALYLCNHLAGQPVRLCQLEVVNQFDVRPFYAEAATAHQAILAQLTVPADKFYASEEFGGNFTSANGLRTQQWNAMTPAKLDGIGLLNTQELAQRLKSAQPPVLVEVTGSFAQLIPTAVVLQHGGLAMDDPARETAYAKRFEALLKLLAPDPAAPLVFYCAGRELWLSVNAALRAQKLGYSQVLWYRGGYESWRAAGLPMAPTTVQAVAN